MNHSYLKIEEVKTNRDIPFDLLDLADPSRAMIEEYLKTGTCYLAKVESQVIGALVLDPLGSDRMEIKNIAVAESEQGKGYGKALLAHAERIAREYGAEKLIIGTGNSSLNQLALYQKAGFEIVGIENDFFTKNYPEPIYENGIPCKHKIILEKVLK